MFTRFFFFTTWFDLDLHQPCDRNMKYLCLRLYVFKECGLLSEKNPFSSLGFPLFLHVRDLLSLLRKRSNTAVRVFKKKKKPTARPRHGPRSEEFIGQELRAEIFLVEALALVWTCVH